MIDDYLEIELQTINDVVDESIDISFDINECLEVELQTYSIDENLDIEFNLVDYDSTLEVEIPTERVTVIGTRDYNDLVNKPQVNGVILKGNKTIEEFNIQTSQLENNGDGHSPFATKEYVITNGGKIDVIELNGEAQEIRNKTVDLVINKVVVGLSNVDNTSDMSKPVSVLQQKALDLKQNVMTTITNEEIDTLFI